jgi:hypothetical protein
MNIVLNGCKWGRAMSTHRNIEMPVVPLIMKELRVTGRCERCDFEEVFVLSAADRMTHPEQADRNTEQLCLRHAMSEKCSRPLCINMEEDYFFD